MYKNIKILVFLIVLCLLVPVFDREASAVSVDVYGGVGSQIHAIAGLEILFYEGKNADLFIGAEETNMASTQSGLQLGSQWFDVDYAVKIKEATFGFRWKIRTSSRWTPYVSLGGVAGNADYSINQLTKANLTILSPLTGTSSFVGARAGVGTDIAFGDQFSVGIEISGTQGPPAYNIVVKDSSSGRIMDVALTEHQTMLVSTIRLRYTF